MNKMSKADKLILLFDTMNDADFDEYRQKMRKREFLERSQPPKKSFEEIKRESIEELDEGTKEIYKNIGKLLKKSHVKFIVSLAEEYFFSIRKLNKGHDMDMIKDSFMLGYYIGLKEK